MFTDIVDSPYAIAKIDSLLQRIERTGYQRLIDNFCSQTDAKRARDYLFEASLCGWLLDNIDLVNLEYEPSSETKPPDFRFKIGIVNFDIQIKRVYQIGNEMIQDTFKQELQRRLSSIPKPWFINYWVSSSLKPYHINLFCEFIEKNLNSFCPESSEDDEVNASQYCWQEDGQVLVSFSFSLNRSGSQGIYPGITLTMGTEYDLLPEIELEPIRSKVGKILVKSSKTFNRPVSATQANIVVMQANSEMWMDNNIIDYVLWGDVVYHIPVGRSYGESYCTRSDNGLFRRRKFKWISGLVLVAPGTTPIDEDFSGTYFPNPFHHMITIQHPKPFCKLTCMEPWGVYGDYTNNKRDIQICDSSKYT